MRYDHYSGSLGVKGLIPLADNLLLFRSVKYTPPVFISLFFVTSFTISGARDSSFGIATVYLLGGPVFEPRLEARFSEPVLTNPEAHPASSTMVK